ncbi:hypothetical protein GCM10007386_45940 [Pseudoduganella dura]|nr:hypothetical protein GCM10007386_45940 [Pseudoduganella dura]
MHAPRYSPDDCRTPPFRGNGRSPVGAAAGASNIAFHRTSVPGTHRDDGGRPVPFPISEEPTNASRKAAGTSGACVPLCPVGTAAAAGRRAMTGSESRAGAAGAAATQLIPANLQPQGPQEMQNKERIR